LRIEFYTPFRIDESKSKLQILPSFQEFTYDIAKSFFTSFMELLISSNLATKTLLVARERFLLDIYF